MRTLLAISFPALALTGCPDAEGQYDEFKDRHYALYPPGSGGEGGATTDGGTCVPPKPGEMDGDYLFTFAAVLDPTKPVLFATKVTTADAGGLTSMSWTIQGLLWSDRKTLVGDPIQLPAATINADGTFKAKLPPLSLVGETNPFSHSPLEADVTLEGKFCGSGPYCGTFSGNVTKPIPLDLAGSSWTLEKVTGTDYPEPPTVNCKGLLAVPVCCVPSPPTCTGSTTCPK
jgi:hypothetical protein